MSREVFLFLRWCLSILHYSLHPNDEVFLAFLRRSMKCLLHRLLSDASFEVLDDEEKAVLEQWVASSSALLLREATKNAHEKIILHVSLAIRRLWTPAFLCSLSFKKWPGKSSNIFSPTFFGAKRQKSPMPFKAKKRLFPGYSALLSSHLKLP